MKAMVCTKYGSPDVLQLREVAIPVPKDKEVRVKIHATTVTSGDCRIRSFNSPALYWIPMRIVLGLRKPRNPILGFTDRGDRYDIIFDAVGKISKSSCKNMLKPGGIFLTVDVEAGHKKGNVVIRVGHGNH